MSRNRELRIAPAARFASDGSAPLLRYTGQRVYGTAGAASSILELPARADMVEIRCTDTIFIRFGSSDVGAAAPGAASMMVAAGEKPLIVPIVDGDRATHVSIIRLGSSDVAVQIEGVETE